jgi:hypothetical protein
MRLLAERHEVLANAIAALEAVLRLKGASGRAANDDREGDDFDRGEAHDAVLGAVVAVLCDANDGLGAKEIQRRLLNRGLVLSYHALYRTLKRHAASSSGVLVRRGENFGLRETGQQRHLVARPREENGNSTDMDAGEGMKGPRS